MTDREFKNWLLIGGALMLFAPAIGRLIGRQAGALPGQIVVGAGEGLGIPATSQSGCCAAIREYEAAQAAGDWTGQATASFKVSAHCPLTEYLSWAAGRGRPAYCGSA